MSVRSTIGGRNCIEPTCLWFGPADVPHRMHADHAVVGHDQRRLLAGKHNLLVTVRHEVHLPASRTYQTKENHYFKQPFKVWVLTVDN